MSGVGSILIAVGTVALMSGWLWVAKRPHPQHAARYRPDPVALPVLSDTVTFAAVEGQPSWAPARRPWVAGEVHLEWGDRPLSETEARALNCRLTLEEEATARAAYGELVFGTAGGMGCDSGAMAAVLDNAGLEAVLHHELHLIDELDLPGEDGPVFPPCGPAGAGCESEGSGLTAPPAPVPCPECGETPCWLAEL